MNNSTDETPAPAKLVRLLPSGFHDASYADIRKLSLKDLGLTSMQILEFAMAVETEFDTTFGDQDLFDLWSKDMEWFVEFLNARR